MRILVTGLVGFIGRALLRRLLTEDGAEITGSISPRRRRDQFWVLRWRCQAPAAPSLLKSWKVKDAPGLSNFSS